MKDWKLQSIMVSFVIMIIALFLFFTQVSVAIHQSLGSYGVQILRAQNKNTIDILGTWWNTYDVFEAELKQWMVSTFLLGLGIGCLGTITVFRFMVTQKADEAK